MDISTVSGLVAVVLLVLANGFFVATEFAIVAVRRSRLEQLANEGHPTARAANDVVGHLDSYIAACQFGITVASLGLGWLGEPALAHLIEPPLERLIGQFAPAAAHGTSIAIAFALITGLHIVIGELAPKGLALQRAEATALWVARPMQLFYLLFRAPINLLNAVGNRTLRLFGLEPATGHEMVHSVEELRLLVTGMQRAGVVEASEARIASRAFSFADLTAGTLMTPRPELEALPVNVSRSELLETVAKRSHARLLVYDGAIDNIVGVLHVQDLLKVLHQIPTEADLRALVRPALFVPDSKAADDVLEEMRTSGHRVAVVIDEYGGTAGMITLVDLMQGLVGRIEEEPNPALPPHQHYIGQVESDGSIQLDGRTRLDELEEILGFEIPEPVHDNAETLGGVVMYLLGRIPEVRDEATLAGRVLRVEELDGHRVALVRVLATGDPPDGEAPVLESVSGDGTVS